MPTALPIPSDFDEQLAKFDRFDEPERCKKGHSGALYLVAFFENAFKVKGVKVELTKGQYDVLDGFLIFPDGTKISIQIKTEILFWSKFAEYDPDGGFSLTPGPQYDHAKEAQLLFFVEVPDEDDVVKIWQCTDLCDYEKHRRRTNGSICYVFPRHKMTLIDERDQPEWAQLLRLFS